MFKPIIGDVFCAGTVTGTSGTNHKPVISQEPKSPLMRGSCTSATGQKRIFLEYIPMSAKLEKQTFRHRNKGPHSGCKSDTAPTATPWSLNRP